MYRQKAYTFKEKNMAITVRITLYEWTKEYGGEHLLQEWDRAQNSPLQPWAVLAHAHRKVWWRCEKGHRYQAEVRARVAGEGCPYCENKLTSKDESDLETAIPEIAAQWNKEKNGTLTSRDVTVQSNRPVWWTCPQGHIYRTKISNRTQRKTGCPVCAGRQVLAGFNDLLTLEPEIAAQWHPTLNEGLTPKMVTKDSAKYVWWQCQEGHVWHATVRSRTGHRRCECPLCAGLINPARDWRYRRSMERLAQRNAMIKRTKERIGDGEPYYNAV